MSPRASAAALLLPLLLLTACGTGVDEATAAAGGTTAGEATAGQTTADGADTSACAAVPGPMIEANTGPGESQLEVPQPDGWERNAQMDSELVRLVLVNKSLARDGFAPNLVVTGEPSPADPQEAFELQLETMRQGLNQTEVAGTEGELCGHPSMTVEYLLPSAGGVPERPAVVQMVVVPHGDQSFTYSFTTQSTAPAEGSYEQDVQTMLEGVQITD